MVRKIHDVSPKQLMKKVQCVPDLLRKQDSKIASTETKCFRYFPNKDTNTTYLL